MVRFDSGRGGAVRRMRSDRQYRGREFPELVVLRNLRRDSDCRDSAALRGHAHRDVSVAAADRLLEPEYPDGMHRLAHLFQSDLRSVQPNLRKLRWRQLARRMKHR